MSLDRLNPSPTVRELVNQAGVPYREVTFAESQSQDTPCADIFTFEEKEPELRLVSVVIARTFDSQQDAIQVAQAIWAKLLQQDITTRIDPEALAGKNALFTIDSARIEDTDKFAMLSIEHRGLTYIVRVNIVAR